MRFDGTHNPGEHQVIVPTPPQVILPERKVIGAKEAAKWHATRGGAVAADADPVLLADLVAGWALTAGPQQTLDSTGVIASGPRDLTSTGDMSFSSSGARFPGTQYPPTGYMSHPNNSVFNMAGSDWELEFIYKIPSTVIEQNYLFGKLFGSQPGENDQLLVRVFHDTLGGPNSIDILVCDGAVSNFVTASAPREQFNYVGVWYTASTKTLSIQINGGTVQNKVLTTGMSNTDGVLAFGYDSYEDGCDGWLKYVRLWIGSLKTDSRTWRYNAGAGRTDAEVAAYTG